MAAKDLRNERATLINQARDLANKVGVTAEDRIAADAMLNRADELKAQIDQLERIDSLSAELDLPIRAAARTDRKVHFVSDAAQDVAIFNKIVAGGAKALRDEEKQYYADSKGRDLRILTAMSQDGGIGELSAEDRSHFRNNFKNAASTTTTTAGGFTIAPLFQAELLIALKAFGGMRAVSRNISTETGAALPFPTMDDTANLASIVGTENSTLSADTDITFGQTSLGAFTYRSGPMPVSLQLLQDSAFDFGSVVEQAMVNRFGRKQNADFTTGAGTTLPFGVITGAASGTVGAAGQTLTVIYDDFVNLIHSVDPAYRDGARFMFHDSVLKALRLLKDTQGRPLFVPSVAAGVPDTIADYPFTINQQMPVMAANAKSVLFGNFSNYIIRDVLGMQMMVLRERFADNLQVAWLAFMRTDGKLISAASPIKYYANSAT